MPVNVCLNGLGKSFELMSCRSPCSREGESSHRLNLRRKNGHRNSRGTPDDRQLALGADLLVRQVRVQIVDTFDGFTIH